MAIAENTTICQIAETLHIIMRHTITTIKENPVQSLNIVVLFEIYYNHH